MRTTYEFTLPRGYVDDEGRVHRHGTMRLATARDELEPLRHPLVTGPDDPRLTVMVLGRVVETLGDLSMVTDHEIEGLFAVDLAFLQDFYGVINFGSQDEYEALLEAQDSSSLVGTSSAARPAAAGGGGTLEGTGSLDGGGSVESADEDDVAASAASRPSLRSAIEELPRQAQ